MNVIAIIIIGALAMLAVGIGIGKFIRAGGSWDR